MKNGYIILYYLNQKCFSCLILIHLSSFHFYVYFVIFPLFYFINVLRAHDGVLV